MRDLTKRLIELTQEAQRIGNSSEIAVKQFQLAADKGDKEEMEKARIAAHEFLDQFLDMHQELSGIRDKQMSDLLGKFGKK